MTPKGLEQQEQQLAEQFEGMTYSDLILQLKQFRGKIIGYAKDYIPALCVLYKREHLTMTHEDIKRQVTNDCLALELWTALTIKVSLPKWVNRTYPLNTKRFKSDLNSTAAAAAEQEAEQVQERIKAYNQSMLEFPDREDLQAEQEEEKQQQQSTSYKQVTKAEPKPVETPDPTEVYNKTVRAAASFWSALTTTDANRPSKFIPSNTRDAYVDFIKPTRNARLSLFKGLEPMQVKLLIMNLIWIDMLIQDTLKMSKELGRESKTEITK